MKKSKYQILGKEKLQEIVNSSNSYREVIIKSGLSSNGSGGYEVLKKYINNMNIDTSVLDNNRTKEKERHLSKQRKEILSEEIFIENSLFNRKVVRKRILRDGLKDYRCGLCGNDGKWEEKDLSLHLDHINGISNDNRLENLRFLCPNCHSQTENFGSKNTARKKIKKIYTKKCPICGNLMPMGNVVCSNKCSIKKNRKVDWDNIDLLNVLEENNFNFSKTGRQLGVSDSTIRKRYRYILKLEKENI